MDNSRHPQSRSAWLTIKVIENRRDGSLETFQCHVHGVVILSVADAIVRFWMWQQFKTVAVVRTAEGINGFYESSVVAHVSIR